VINPNSLSQTAESKPGAAPFAEKAGEVEPMLKRDLALWLTIVLASASVSCILLNLTVYHASLWSLPIAGACVMLWVFFCPGMFHQKFPFSLSLILDTVCVILYEYMITFLTQSSRWFFSLALPITLSVAALAGLFSLLTKKVSSSLLSTVLYFFLELAALCLIIECLVDRFMGLPLMPGWSAIVFYACGVIAVALIAVMSIARLRDVVRKRFHF
jgi:hypothetical protein